MKSSLLLIALLCTTAHADQNTGWDATLYGYARHTHGRQDSLLNPENRIARLPQNSTQGEIRLNFKVDRENLRLSGRAISLWQESDDGPTRTQQHDAYLSQWQIRARLSDAWHVAAGRDRLNWGPAQFRSPSSPFYFNNGRNDPLRELIGMDALKISWTPDTAHSASLIRLVGNGHDGAQQTLWHDSWLTHLEQRGEAWALGLIALKAPNSPAFYGGYLQNTVSDALLIYLEASSATQAQVWQAGEDNTQPFLLQNTSPRRSTALLGAAYTLENGQTLTAEYLHDQHGYTAPQTARYFQQAIQQPALALGFAPRLLGRDYLHLVWQSNLMAESGFWRLMASHNLTDHGKQLSAYAESVLTRQLTAYLLATFPIGNRQQEFSALLQNSLTLGIKIALP